MSSCKTRENSFLGHPAPPPEDIHTKNEHLAAPTGGLMTLITLPPDAPRCNICEYSAVVKPSSPVAATVAPKKDPGCIGFLDEVVGGVDGLMSCTESLGFESSDERRLDDNILDEDVKVQRKWRRPKAVEKREIKKFPPPLPSLSYNGQRRFFLRPVRRDGRLEITEVRISRPEILRASREDGRLRLQLIRDDQDTGISEEEEQEEEEEEAKEEEIFVGSSSQPHPPDELQSHESPNITGSQIFELEEEKSDSEEVEGKVGRWVYGEGGIRRCHEEVGQRHNQQHHQSNHPHHLQVWRQHCVSSG